MPLCTNCHRVRSPGQFATVVFPPRLFTFLESSLPAALAGDSHQYPDCEPAREHEGSAIAEERKWDSRDRHEVERHADIHEDVDEPARHQTERNQRAE